MRIRIDDLELAYSDEGSGVPVLFVHGFPFRRGVWDEQVRALRSSYRVIAPDLRGFGESPAGDGPATMERFAEDLRALLERLGSGPAVVVGHSMGGYVALAFARHCSAMLRGLCLVASKAGADSPEAATGRRALAERVRREGPQVVVDAMAPKMLAQGASDPRRDPQVRELMAPANPAGWSAALVGMADRVAASDLLPRIAAPTLVATGADDVLIPAEESRHMASAIPGARLAVLPQAGHLVAWERPAEFNRTLGDWLATAIAPPRSR